MPVEDAADRAVFFDGDDFGIAATYTPAVGAGVAVTVLSWTPDTHGVLQTIGIRLTAAAQAAARVVLLRRDEIAAPARGDVLTIGTDDYPVREAILLDDGQVWQLALDKPS